MNITRTSSDDTSKGKITTPNSIGGLNTTQRDILWVLHREGPSKGAAVKDALGEYYGREVSHGSIYPNLDTLVDRGLVEWSRRDRRTNEYTLTQTAEQLLADRQAWQRGGGE